MSEITVTVSGPIGCGKSAIAGEIEIALRALGVPVSFADPAAMQSEKNMTHADWTGYLEMYEPSVVISEAVSPPSEEKAAELLSALEPLAALWNEDHRRWYANEPDGAVLAARVRFGGIRRAAAALSAYRAQAGSAGPGEGGA